MDAIPKNETPSVWGDYSSRKISFGDDLGDSRLLPGEEFPFEGTIEWRSRYFKAAASVLQGPSYSEDNPPSLGEGGANLAWNLAYLMTAEPDRFARVLDSLREVVPLVKRIRARPVSIVKMEKKVISIDDRKQVFDQQSTVMGQELIFDMVSGEGLPASAVSEGTLVVLAFLTLLYGDESADLIMLDDVELGLHPPSAARSDAAIAQSAGEKTRSFKSLFRPTLPTSLMSSKQKTCGFSPPIGRAAQCPSALASTPTRSGNEGVIDGGVLERRGRKLDWWRRIGGRA